MCNASHGAVSSHESQFEIREHSFPLFQDEPLQPKKLLGPVPAMLLVSEWSGVHSWKGDRIYQHHQCYYCPLPDFNSSPALVSFHSAYFHLLPVPGTDLHVVRLIGSLGHSEFEEWPGHALWISSLLEKHTAALLKHVTVKQ